MRKVHGFTSRHFPAIEWWGGGGRGLAGRLVDEERAGEGENFPDVGRGWGVLFLPGQEVWSEKHWIWLELAMEFHSEKIPRNSLGTDSVIPRKKVLIPTEYQTPRKSPFRSLERNGMEFRWKIVFRNCQKDDLSVLQKSSFWPYFWNLWLTYFVVRYTAARWPISGPHTVTQKYKSIPGKCQYRVYIP